MIRSILENLGSVLLVVLLSILLLSVIRSDRALLEGEATRLIAPFLTADSLDPGDPLQRTLFKESLRTFYPDREARNDSIVAALDAYGLKKVTRAEEGRPGRGLSPENIRRIAWMYVRFVAIFAVVIILTYVGARMAAVFKFMQTKQGTHSSLSQLAVLFSRWRSGDVPPNAFKRSAVLFLKALFKGVITLLLFSPAYVIAYAFKTELDTGSVLFMVLLAVVSNGLLMNFANKFYTFLIHESRKGYVETATVKGLDDVYVLPSGWGERILALLMPLRAHSRHVFRHLYSNAAFQYIPVVKEHAAFVVTGIIIIEMALNIQGHLCYELLQSIMFNDYDVAVVIVVGIFLAVKAAEMFIDVWHYREAQKYQLS